MSNVTNCISAFQLCNIANYRYFIAARNFLSLYVAWHCVADAMRMQQWNQIRLPVPWTASPAVWLPLSRCTKEFRCPRGLIKASFTRHCAAYSLQIIATTAVLFSLRLECASEGSGRLFGEAGPRLSTDFVLVNQRPTKWLMVASAYYQRLKSRLKKSTAREQFRTLNEIRYLADLRDGISC